MTPRRDDDDITTDRRPAALMGLIVILVLAILAVILVRELGRQTRLQDCVMSGRSNCAPIETPPRQ